jgi:type III secretion system FlhB-like substrate exporter
MAILDLQRREMESGRIRFGNKVGNRPNRLDHPLLTSPDKELLAAVARGYDVSLVSEWPGGEGQWQVEIDADLNVLIPVQPEPVSQWWERWSGGGCMRRCDGITDQINDAPCDCDKTADKRACSATTRITVLLPETGDARWRIETKSLYAAIELPAALEKAMGERTGEVIPAVLSVEQRNGKKGKVPVPVIKIAKSGASVSAPEPETVAVSGDPVESRLPVLGSDAGDSQVISEPQRKRMMAKAREHNVETADLKVLVADLAGVTSSKDIPTDKYDTVINAIENWAEWQAQLVPQRQEDVG